MKKPSYSLFFVDPLTIVYIVMGFVFNRFLYLFIHYLIAFIHEMSHVCSAKIFKVAVPEIHFLPFGFYAKIQGLEQKNLLTQIIVIISGPLSYFISWGILTLMYRMDLISIYGFEQGMISNQAVLLFNLLPFYPLDGGRIVDVIGARFLDEYKLRVVRLIFNVLTFFYIGYLCITNRQIILMIFIAFSLIAQWMRLKKDFFKDILRRLGNKKPLHERVNTKKEIYRYSNNYYLENHTIYNEDQLIEKIVKDQKYQSFDK